MLRILINAYFTICSESKHFLLLLLLIGIPIISFSQNDTKIDSLKNLLSSSGGDEKIEILDQLSDLHLKIDTKKSLEYSREMLVLSKKINNDFQLQKAFLNCTKSFYYLSRFDSVLIYADSTVQLQNQTKNDTVSAKGYMFQCNASIIKGNYDAALINGEKALNTYRKINDTLEIATAQKNISYIYKARGEYDQAMTYAMDALNTFEQSGDSMRIASGLGTIANIYLNIGKNDLAKEYFLNAQKVLIHQQNTLMYSRVVQAIAGIYRLEGKNDSSLYLYNQALTIAENMNNPLLTGKINMNMANTLKANDQIDKALIRFKEAKTIFININSEKDINHVNYSLGETYFQAKSYDSAEIYLKKSLVTSKRINHALIYEGSLNQLYLLYEEKKNFQNAYDYYKLYTQFHDSITGERVQLNIAELETKYETSKKEQEILELKYNQEIQETWTFTLKLIIVGVIAIFILIIIGIWQKRKKDKLIQRQKDLFSKKAKELTELELEKSKLKEEELQQSILYKSKQLSTHALHMMQKNTMLQEMQLELKTLSKKASIDDKQDFKRMNLQINQSLRSHKDWDVFKLYFEDVNRNFYQKLNDINPELTTNDHRLCALIKLNMTSKEMASVLNVAPNSIKSSRYRLKKKLGLEVEADLEEFIRSLV